MAALELTLRCKQHAVLTAAYDPEIHAFLKVTEVVSPELVPFGARDGSGSLTRGKLNTWWQDRAIPVTRDGYETLRARLGDVSALDLLERSHGLSLSDQYWMECSDDDLRWEDINFFDNPFDDELGMITLGEASDSDGAAAFKKSPNSSLGGNLKKAWVADGRHRILLKAGSAPFYQEPYGEVIATELYSRLLSPGDYVPYRLVERESGTLSSCPCMVTRDECLVPAWELINSVKHRGDMSNWQHLVHRYEDLGLADAKAALIKMFVCDYILANRDRHWNNFGVVFDADTMQAKRVAPIFDTGSCLWFDAASLELPIDFWYRPLPLIPERARRIYPEDQLALMDDYSWFDPDSLDGFPEAAGETLAKNGKLDAKRVDAVMARVRQNIAEVARRASARKAALGAVAE